MNVDKVKQLLALCEKYDYKPDQIHLNNLTDFLSENASQVAGICKTVLAALTAEPVIYAIQNKDERENGYMTEFSSSGIAGYVNPEKYGLTELALYTTPPAQLLRPVELPDCDYGAVSHMSGGSKDYCNGFVDGTNNAIKAIREAGYEVKS